MQAGASRVRWLPSFRLGDVLTGRLYVMHSFVDHAREHVQALAREDTSTRRRPSRDPLRFSVRSSCRRAAWQTSSWLSTRAVRGLLWRMVRDENPRLKTWQSRRGVPPCAAAHASKQNAPAIYRRGRARRDFFVFLIWRKIHFLSQAARTRLPTAACKRNAS